MHRRDWPSVAYGSCEALEISSSCCAITLDVEYASVPVVSCSSVSGHVTIDYCCTVVAHHTRARHQLLLVLVAVLYHRYRYLHMLQLSSPINRAQCSQHLDDPLRRVKCTSWLCCSARLSEAPSSRRGLCSAYVAFFVLWPSRSLATMIVKLELDMWPIGTKSYRLQYQNTQKRWRVDEPRCRPTPL